MAKRFTDTDKWKRPWFSELSLQAKLTWIYLLDDCDHRGVWFSNFKRASFDLGFEIDASKLSDWFGPKLILIDEDKFYIPSFVEFQYKGELSETNKAHKPILAFLAKYSEKILPHKPLSRGLGGAQDKEQDKEWEKEKDKEKEEGESEGKQDDYLADVPFDEPGAR